MDVWRLLGSAFRRWHVFVPLLALTGLAVGFSGNLSPAEYQASGVIAIIPRTAVTDADRASQLASNPYVALDSSARMLSYVISSSAVRQDLVRQGLSDHYTATSSDRSAVVEIEVEAGSGPTAVETGSKLIAMAKADMNRRQGDARVAPDEFVEVNVLDAVDDSVRSVSGQIQAAAAIGAVGIVVSFLTAVLVDDLVLARRRRMSRTENWEASPPFGLMPATYDTGGPAAEVAPGGAGSNGVSRSSSARR